VALSAESHSLPPDEVHVWQFGLDRPAAHLAELERALAPDERARAARFRAPRHRDRFIAGRGLLRTLLGRYRQAPPEALAFAYGPHGKPSLSGPGGAHALEFNLAHSEGRGLLAVARHPVGIDVEVLRDRVDVEAVAASFFSPEELAAFRALPQRDRRRAFFTVWTRKEAFMKATGRGLSEAPAGFAVLAVAGSPALRLVVGGRPEEGLRWSLCDLDVGDGSTAALAVAGRGWRLVSRELADAPWPR
jgi:4'-phosphopantetheinyl transferase